MSTTQDYATCDRCDREYMYEFNLKTGKRSRITQCGCDAEVSGLEKKLENEAYKCAVLLSALEAIAECTDRSDDNPVKVAEDTLSAYAALKS